MSGRYDTVLVTSLARQQQPRSRMSAAVPAMMPSVFLRQHFVFRGIGGFCEWIAWPCVQWYSVTNLAGRRKDRLPLLSLIVSHSHRGRRPTSIAIWLRSYSTACLLDCGQSVVVRSYHDRYTLSARQHALNITQLVVHLRHLYCSVNLVDFAWNFACSVDGKHLVKIVICGYYGYNDFYFE